jgi:hypothetical protein
MKKLPILVATCVLSLWGCASSRPGTVADYLNETEIARRDRIGAPTVYNGEATGGPGFTVTTGDGRTWAPELAPGNTVAMTQSDVSRLLAEQDGQSEVIDEGPTESAPQQ